MNTGKTYTDGTPDFRILISQNLIMRKMKYLNYIELNNLHSNNLNLKDLNFNYPYQITRIEIKI